MKNNFKFFVAVFGITTAFLGSYNVKAKIAPKEGYCINAGDCGKTADGRPISGKFTEQ